LLKYVEPLVWTNFFNLKESVLPQLVQAFYHNANVHPDKNLIIFDLKGTQIQLDPNVISDLLKIPLEGVEIYGNKWFSKLDINRETLIGEMFNEQGAQMTNPSSSFLKKEFKILHNICLHSIFPRTGSKDKVTENDFLVMHHLSKGIKLNLPYLIIQHLIYAASSDIKKIALPYGMILTRIFRMFKIDETNQRIDNSYTPFGLKNVHHMKKEVVSEESVGLGKRKRDTLVQEGLDLLVDAMGEHLENILQAGDSAATDIGMTTESIPSHLSTSLHFGTPFSHGFTTVPPRSGKNLEAFFSTNPATTTVFSPLMSSSQGSLHTLLSSEFRKTMDGTNSEFPRFPSTLFSTESLPSFPASFATLDSF
jgi:hypothetical protein